MKNIFSILVLCSIRIAAISQDVHLSQFYETPLMRNPALAGVFTGNVRFQSVSRTQWSWSGAAYKTTALSGEFKFPIGYSNDFLTVGGQVFYDVAGTSKLTTLQIMPAINFHKSLNENKAEFISGGIMCGAFQKKFDPDNLSFNNQYVNGQYDPQSPTGEFFNTSARTNFDLDAGLAYNSAISTSGAYFVGIAAYHLNRPKENFQNTVIELPLKIQFNGGLHLPLSLNSSIIVEGNISDQAERKEILLGALVNYDFQNELYNTEQPASLKTLSITAGLFFRLNDAMIPVVKLNYNGLEMGISYDVNISTLKTASKGNGGFELSLSYKLMKRGVDAMQQLCPRF